MSNTNEKALQVKHTPAPWAVWKMGGNLTVTATGDGVKKHKNEGMHIATIRITEAVAYQELFAANARLIAAAPDLLSALRDMLSGWRYIRDTHGDLYGVGWHRAQNKAEDAIKKAEGGQQ